MYSYSKYGTRAASGATSAPKAAAPPPTTTPVPSTGSINPGAARPTGPRALMNANKKQKVSESDFSNQFVHTRTLSTDYIRNVDLPMDGYPKLQKLKELKAAQVAKHACKPYGVRVDTQQIVPTLNKWVNEYSLQFDVIMIGALVENQFLLPLLSLLPLYKLCAKPGFLFIWTTTANIKQLTVLLNGDKWNKKFRRSEELVFVPVDENSPYFPKGVNDGFYGDSNGAANGNGESLLRRRQWHCWMCITGTVRRSTDADLIHCNVDTDLQIERRNHAPPMQGYNNAVPDAIYTVAENFSNSNRRLHIVPCRTGYKLPVKMRKGWVIMLPDVLVSNFDPIEYEAQMFTKSQVKYKNTTSNGQHKQLAQYLVPQTAEIESLRPKSPV